jgi:hypothetical protein
MNGKEVHSCWPGLVFYPLTFQKPSFRFFCEISFSNANVDFEGSATIGSRAIKKRTRSHLIGEARFLYEFMTKTKGTDATQKALFYFLPRPMINYSTAQIALSSVSSLSFVRNKVRGIVQ